jgi:hypothetical protein
LWLAALAARLAWPVLLLEVWLAALLAALPVWPAL